MDTETSATFTRTSKIWLGDDGILRATYLPGVQETQEDAQENVVASRSIMRGQPRPVLLDQREIGSQSRDARIYYTKADPQSYRALAILIGSPMSRVIGNFAIGLNRGSYPARLFTVEAEAIAWLKEFLA